MRRWLAGVALFALLLGLVPPGTVQAAYYADNLIDDTRASLDSFPGKSADKLADWYWNSSLVFPTLVPGVSGNAVQWQAQSVPSGTAPPAAHTYVHPNGLGPNKLSPGQAYYVSVWVWRGNSEWDPALSCGGSVLSVRFVGGGSKEGSLGTVLQSSYGKLYVLPADYQAQALGTWQRYSASMTVPTAALTNGVSGFYMDFSGCPAAGLGTEAVAFDEFYIGTTAISDVPPAPVDAPTDVQASVLNGGSDVAWSPVATGTVDGYRVYVDGALAGTSTTTTYQVRNLTNYVAHTIEVAAYNDGGEGPKSAAATVTPYPPDKPPPKARLIFTIKNDYKPWWDFWSSDVVGSANLVMYSRVYLVDDNGNEIAPLGPGSLSWSIYSAKVLLTSVADQVPGQELPTEIPFSSTITPTPTSIVFTVDCRYGSVCVPEADGLLLRGVSDWLEFTDEGMSATIDLTVDGISALPVPSEPREGETHATPVLTTPTGELAPQDEYLFGALRVAELIKTSMASPYLLVWKFYQFGVALTTIPPSAALFGCPGALDMGTCDSGFVAGWAFLVDVEVLPGIPFGLLRDGLLVFISSLAAVKLLRKIGS